MGLKFRFGYDDSLDVVGVHLVGGIIGTVLIGFLADPGSPAGVAGLFYGGGVDQLWRQVVGAAAVLIYSFVLSYVIALVVKAIMGSAYRQRGRDQRHRRGGARGDRVRLLQPAQHQRCRDAPPGRRDAGGRRARPAPAHSSKEG